MKLIKTIIINMRKAPPPIQNKYILRVLNQFKYLPSQATKANNKIKAGI